MDHGFEAANPVARRHGLDRSANNATGRPLSIMIGPLKSEPGSITRPVPPSRAVIPADLARGGPAAVLRSSAPFPKFVIPGGNL
jgi:hypothetical protein